ncbi:MAG: O-antigen ligase family protein [Nitrospirota bacterium]
MLKGSRPTNTLFIFFGVLLGLLILISDYVSYFLIVGLPAGILAILVMPDCYSKAKHLISELRWWHGLWVLMLLSGLVFRIRDTSTLADSPLDPWALFRIGLMTLIGVVLFHQLIINRIDWINSLSQGCLALLTGYAALSLFSISWSVYPSWTLYKALEYLVDLALIAAIVVVSQNVHILKALFDWTWALLGILLVTVWFWVIVWPEEAILRKIGLLGMQIHGVWPAMETNGVGELAAVLGLVSFTRLLFLHRRERLFYSLAFLFSFVTLVFAQSRSPLTAFGLGITVVLFVSRRIGWLSLAFVGAAILFSFTSASESLWEYFQRGQKDKEFESLSGRTLLWSVGWELFKAEPLLGYGAYAGARFTGITEQMGSGGSSILNTWMEIILGVGLPGFVLIAIVFLRIWVILSRITWKTTDQELVHRLGVEALGVLTIISVRSMFSPQLIWHPPITFFVVLGYAELVRRLAINPIYEIPVNPQLLSATRR